MLTLFLLLSCFDIFIFVSSEPTQCQDPICVLNEYCELDLPDCVEFCETSFSQDWMNISSSKLTGIPTRTGTWDLRNFIKPSHCPIIVTVSANTKAPECGGKLKEKHTGTERSSCMKLFPGSVGEDLKGRNFQNETLIEVVIDDDTLGVDYNTDIANRTTMSDDTSHSREDSHEIDESQEKHSVSTPKVDTVESVAKTKVPVTDKNKKFPFLQGIEGSTIEPTDIVRPMNVTSGIPFDIPSGNIVKYEVSGFPLISEDRGDRIRVYIPVQNEEQTSYVRVFRKNVIVGYNLNIIPYETRVDHKFSTRFRDDSTTPMFNRTVPTLDPKTNGSSVISEERPQNDQLPAHEGIGSRKTDLSINLREGNGTGNAMKIIRKNFELLTERQTKSASNDVKLTEGSIGKSDPSPRTSKSVVLAILRELDQFMNGSFILHEVSDYHLENIEVTWSMQDESVYSCDETTLPQKYPTTYVGGVCSFLWLTTFGSALGIFMVLILLALAIFSAMSKFVARRKSRRDIV